MAGDSAGPDRPITTEEAVSSHQCWWRKLAEGLAATLADLDSDSALSALRQILRSERERRHATEQRTMQLEQLAVAILASYHKTSDGYRGRVGQVQIAKWQAVLDGQP